MKLRSLLIFLLLSTFAQSRQRVEGFDFRFNPTRNVPFYQMVTEKRDSGWYREGYYYPSNLLASVDLFSDEKATVPNGISKRYYKNGQLKSIGRYVQGKKTGDWLSFHENGMIHDSTYYENGKPRGVSLSWDKQGYQSDSSFFDKAGGVFVARWHDNGNLAVQGRLINDTLDDGTWKYYNEDGSKLGEIVYNAGKYVKMSCFDANGNLLPEAKCTTREADFPGESYGWMNYLTKNLNADVPVKRGAPEGTYTVLIQFVVEKDGTLADLKSLTEMGYGMEEEALRILRRSPKWRPAIHFGKPVKAYRIQPITFGVVDE